jgi:uncharacterized protein (DUF779 family)
MFLGFRVILVYITTDTSCINAVMYHSESGGCCDCGDPEAWKDVG